MCGIGGHVGRPVAPRVRARMLAALANRGPDAQRIVTFDDAGTPMSSEVSARMALVHARLSIIDPRPIADQPMASSDGRVWLCYNGEVYGWEEEARRLQARGARFRTHCDTEFILHAYDAHGIEGLLDRLVGMFAFALFDFRTQRVHLVRDRLGKKPLVYARSADGVAFGSTVRSVLPWLPASARAFSAEAIDAFLAHRYIPAPRTIFAGIERLPNAHRAECALDGSDFVVRRYWTPQSMRRDDMPALFDDAVKKRLAADRPLGLFLSSGVDSAAIAARLSAMRHPVRSFSAAFPGSSLDESEDAAATARALGLPNQAIVIPTSIRDDFERIIAALDEPFADPSAFPTWYLAREAVKDIVVVLGGDGGDELFGGYKRIATHARGAWRGGIRIPRKVIADARPKGWRKLVTELGTSWEDAYALRFSGLTPNQRAFLQPNARALPVHYWRAPDAPRGTSIDRLLRWDFANYLPEYVLRKVDLCTMAHGLELRAPLLDHRLVEAVLALPASERYTHPPKRYLARLAPELDRLGVFERKKRGFNPPLRDWLTHDLADRVQRAAASLDALTHGQLARERIATMTAAYATTPALAEQVLSLVMLDESLRQLTTEAADVA